MTIAAAITDILQYIYHRGKQFCSSMNKPIRFGIGMVDGKTKIN